jgi:hypothetical protein
MKGVDSSDLLFQEFQSYVHRALEVRGFRQAASLADADLAILIGYGVGDPQTDYYQELVPVYGETGVQSSETRSHIESFGHFAEAQSRTTYTPRRGVVGYATRTTRVTTFASFVRLSAVDVEQYRSTGKTVEVWRTTAVSAGPSGDLRAVFPALIAASANALGTSTGRILSVEVAEDSPAMARVAKPQHRANPNPERLNPAKPAPTPANLDHRRY